MGKRGKNGGILCIRISLVLFNLITLFAGVGTLAVGLLLFFSSHVEDGAEMEEMLADVAMEEGQGAYLVPRNKEFKGLSIILITLGTLVAFVSFLGCFGACVKGKCLLATYLICVGMILTLQFMVSVFAILYRQPISGTMRKELVEFIKHEYREDTDMAKTWGLAHQTFGCCGVDGYSDWFRIDAWPNQVRVPDSCCLDATNITGCGSEEVDPNKWYKQGCLSSIQLAMMEKLHYLATVIVTLVFLQLYGIIASTLLFYHAKDKESEKSPTQYKTYSYELASRR